MAKKKKNKPKKKLKPLSAEDQARLESWLEWLEREPEESLVKLTQAASDSPDLAQAMLHNLGWMESPEAGWVAHRAEQGLESKPLRKEAKKSLYKLEQKGVQIDRAETGSPIFQAVRQETPFGYLSGYYPDHSQTLALAFPMSGGEGFCGAAICRFEKGFGEIGMAPMRLSQFRRMNQETVGELPWPQLKLETDDLACLLDSIIKTHRAQGGEMGEEVMFLSQWVEEQGEVPEIAPVYGRLGYEPGSGGNYGPRLIELLEEPPCLWWYPEQESWDTARELLEAGNDSGLILSPGLEAEKEDETLARASASLFPESSWPAWKGRLEETAMFLAAMDQKEDAAVFLNAAQDLNRPDHPLFLGLIDKMKELERMSAEREEQEGVVEPASDSGLILPPGLD